MQGASSRPPVSKWFIVLHLQCWAKAGWSGDMGNGTGDCDKGALRGSRVAVPGFTEPVPGAVSNRFGAFGQRSESIGLALNTITATYCGSLARFLPS